MWTVSALDVINLGRRPGGTDFTEFVDALITAHCLRLGIPHSAVLQNLRNNQGDGGVDTLVEQAVASPDDFTGYFATPAVWQFKSSNYVTGPAAMRNEVDKPFLLEQVEQGRAYVYCICDSLPPGKVQGLEKELVDAFETVIERAPVVYVVTADALAKWANNYSAVLLRFFGARELVAQFYDTWGKNQRHLAETYVRVPHWEPIFAKIGAHANLSVSPADVVLPVQGKPGVGKTRLVFEALQGFSDLVVYTPDPEAAKRVASYLAANPQTAAILVADECDASDELFLREALKGHKDRVRVVAIGNQGRPIGLSQEQNLSTPADDTIATILEENYPDIPEDFRRAYAQLSKGYIRLALDIAYHHHEIQKSYDTSPVLPSVSAYLGIRLDKADLRGLEAFALLSRVGVTGDVSGELVLLCHWLGVDVAGLKERIPVLLRAPGFLIQAGRYVYVSPEIVAQSAFQGAWARWGELDSGDLVSRLPSELVDAFLERVKGSASKGVSCVIGDYFRDWARSLSSADLRVTSNVKRLESLAYVDPEGFLPIIRALVEDAEGALLQGLPVQDEGTWGSRRLLVWLAERTAAFPRMYEHSQAILLRLGVNESEPDIQNNATQIWQQLHRIYLSGTAVPFARRLENLRRILQVGSEPEARIAVGAAVGAINTSASRVAGPVLFGGTLLPPDWMPQTGAEERDAWRGVIDLLFDVQAIRPEFSDAGLGAVIEMTPQLLWFGFLRELRHRWAQAVKDSRHNAQLVAEVSEFLELNGRNRSDRESRIAPDYEEEISVWLQELKPTTLGDRVMTLLSSRSFSYAIPGSERKSTIESELEALAHELLSSPTELEGLSPVLEGEESYSATLLGGELGRQDTTGELVSWVLDLIQKPSASIAFARGYLLELLRRSSDFDSEVNGVLDIIEETQPNRLPELLVSAPERTRAYNRLTSLVQAGRINPLHLRLLTHLDLGYSNRIHLLRLILGLPSIDAPAVQEMALSHLFNGLLQAPDWYQDKQLLIESQAALKRTVESAGRSYWWAKCIQTILPIVPAWGTPLVVEALLLHSPVGRSELREVAIDIAGKHPVEFMAAWGAVALEGKDAWRVYVGDYKSIIGEVPHEILVEWIEAHGVEGARVLARSLPSPYLDKDGSPTIPPITDFVLSEFGDDDRTFQEFAAGRHSFQVYMGDIGAQRQSEADLARQFLDSPNRAISRWAAYEVSSGERAATAWRLQQEEDEHFG